MEFLKIKMEKKYRIMKNISHGWKKNFLGKLSYELDNGDNFEIVRDFNKKNPKVYNGNFEEISNQYNIDKKDGLQFFYNQTKVDEMMFLSTIVSMQQEVKLDKQSQQILVQRIANLAGTGDDSTSFKKVLDKLSKRQVDEIGTDRTQGKPINVTKNRMREIEFVLKDMNLLKEEKEKIENKKEYLQNKNINLETENNIIQKLDKINLENNIKKQKIYFNEKNKNELQEKINKNKLEKNNLLNNKKIIEEKNNLLKNNFSENIKLNKKIKNKKNKNKINLFILFFIIFILLEIFNYIYLKNNILYFVNGIVFIFYFILNFILNKIENNKIKKEEHERKMQEKLNMQIEEEKNKNEINIINTKIENIEEQLIEYNKELLNYINEIEKTQKDIDNQIDFTIDNLKREYNNVNIDEILDKVNLSNISNYAERLQNELNNNRLELNSISIEEKNIAPKLENMISLREEYENLREKLNDLENENNLIIKTKEYLINAYEKMKNNITPKFTRNLSNTVEKISNGKYTKVSINDEKGLIVENQYGEYISAERLSTGTVDQLYLSLRLSMIDEISNESMPIILDEAFAYYDETRLENILKFLSDELGNHQLIIFTCTNREKNILDKIHVSYNLVEL